jgi:hypothetical protein
MPRFVLFQMFGATLHRLPHLALHRLQVAAISNRRLADMQSLHGESFLEFPDAPPRAPAQRRRLRESRTSGTRSRFSSYYTSRRTEGETGRRSTWHVSPLSVRVFVFKVGTSETGTQTKEFERYEPEHKGVYISQPKSPSIHFTVCPSFCSLLVRLLTVK